MDALFAFMDRQRRERTTAEIAQLEQRMLHRGAPVLDLG
jgi:hypothetical protein